MHVTTAVAALAGAAFTALGSIVTGLVIQWSTGQRDHLVRLWERQAEVYEKLLAGLSDEKLVRTGVMDVVNSETGNKSKLAKLSAPEMSDVMDDSALMARVIMFGSGKC